MFNVAWKIRSSAAGRARVSVFGGQSPRPTPGLSHGPHCGLQSLDSLCPPCLQTLVTLLDQNASKGISSHATNLWSSAMYELYFVLHCRLTCPSIILLWRHLSTGVRGEITSKTKHAIKHKTTPARLAQLLQPSLAFCFSLQPMTAYRPV